jgi:hypothetical protein
MVLGLGTLNASVKVIRPVCRHTDAQRKQSPGVWGSMLYSGLFVCKGVDRTLHGLVEGLGGVQLCMCCCNGSPGVFGLPL